MQAINFFVPFAVLLLLESSSGATLKDESKEITPIELHLSGIENDVAKEHSEEIPVEDIRVNTLWAHLRVIRQIEAPEEENIQTIPEHSKDGLEYIPPDVLVNKRL